MIHQLIIHQSELLKLKFGDSGEDYVIGKIPAGATVTEHYFDHAIRAHIITYETPDETPCTISVGLAE